MIVGIDEVGRGCERTDAKILTQQGYKRYDQLKETDKVLSYNDIGELIWQNINKLYFYNEDMTLYEMRGRTHHIVVTDNHKFTMIKTLFGKNEKRGRVIGHKLIYQTLDQARAQNYIPRTGKWIGQTPKYFILPTDTNIKILIDLWVQFFGIWLAEGCTTQTKRKNRFGKTFHIEYKVIISQCKNKEKILKIQALLNKLPWKFNYNGGNFSISNKALCCYLSQFGKSSQKYIPNEIKDLSIPLLKQLFKWMVLGDGNVYIPKQGKGYGNAKLPSITYYTCSKKLANDVEEIIIKMGYSFHTQIKKNKEFKGYKANFPSYRIRLCRYSTYDVRMLKRNIKKLTKKTKVLQTFSLIC